MYRERYRDHEWTRSITKSLSGREATWRTTHRSTLWRGAKGAFVLGLVVLGNATFPLPTDGTPQEKHTLLLKRYREARPPELPAPAWQLSSALCFLVAAFMLGRHATRHIAAYNERLYHELEVNEYVGDAPTFDARSTRRLALPLFGTLVVAASPSPWVAPLLFLVALGIVVYRLERKDPRGSAFLRKRARNVASDFLSKNEQSWIAAERRVRIGLYTFPASLGVFLSLPTGAAVRFAELGTPGALAAAALLLAACIRLSLTFPTLVLYAASLPNLLRVHVVERMPYEEWELMASDKPKDHVFMGFLGPYPPTPYLLPKASLSEHCIMTGRSGSGKTSVGLIPLVTQLIRDDARSDTPANVLVIDPKGDPALFHSSREETRRAGRKFRFFTLKHSAASHAFNPFDTLDPILRNNALSLSQVIARAVGGDHGEGYGRSFFSVMGRTAMLEALREQEAGIEALARKALPGLQERNFRGLYHALQEISNSSFFRNAEARQLIATFHALCHYPQLLDDTHEDVLTGERIDFNRAIEDGEVIYFHVSKPMESRAAAEVARLAMWCLVEAAAAREHVDKETIRANPDYRLPPTRQCWLVCDEFHEVCYAQTAQILTACRSFGIGCVFATQSLELLDQHDAMLSEVVATNADVRMFFSGSSPPEMRRWQEMSGEILEHLPTGSRTTATSETRSEGASWGHGASVTSGRYQSSSETANYGFSRGYSRSSGSSYTTGFTSVYRPRLSKEQILWLGWHKCQFGIQVQEGAGDAARHGPHFKTVDGLWSMPLPVYDDRKRTPWPVVLEDDPPPSSPPELPSPRASRPSGYLHAIREERERHRNLLDGVLSDESALESPESDEKDGPED